MLLDAFVMADDSRAETLRPRVVFAVDLAVDLAGIEESSSFFEDEDAFAAGLAAERDRDAFAAAVADAALRDRDPAVVLRLVASVAPAGFADLFADIFAVVLAAPGEALAAFRGEVAFEAVREAVLAVPFVAVLREETELLAFAEAVLALAAFEAGAESCLDAVFLRVVVLAGIFASASSAASAFSSAASALSFAAFAKSFAASAVVSASLAVAAISARISMDLSLGAVGSALGGSTLVAVSSVCFTAA